MLGLRGAMLMTDMAEIRVQPCGDSDDEPSSLLGLARAASAGDVTATTKLLRAIAPRLAIVVKAVLGAAHPDFDDAVQHSLIGFVQALPAFRGDCDPTSYGRVIAVRAAIAMRKRSRRHAGLRDGDVDTDALAIGDPCPRETTAALRRKETLRDLLSELPSEQAEALAMRVMLGCSLEEVAAASGAPTNTIRSRVRLAKERLKSRIERDPTLLEMLGGTS